MTEKRALALLAFLLALVGGVLLAVRALEFGRVDQLTVEAVARHIVDLVLGIAAIIGGLMMYRGRRTSVGGIVTLVIGVLVIVFGGLGAEAAVIIVAGVLGIVAGEARP